MQYMWSVCHLPAPDDFPSSVLGHFFAFRLLGFLNIMPFVSEYVSPNTLGYSSLLMLCMSFGHTRCGDTPESALYGYPW